MWRGFLAGICLLLAAPAEAGLFGSAEYERPTPQSHAGRADLLAKADFSPLAAPAEATFVERLRAVNTAVNAHPYVTDAENYGVADYWATPAEFAARGGDCEDFAIAKYAQLKALGVPATAMRIVIVRDLPLGQSHAVLSVTLGETHYILDNQSSEVLADGDIGHYRPIYSLNEASWWLHLPG